MPGPTALDRPSAFKTDPRKTTAPFHPQNKTESPQILMWEKATKKLITGRRWEENKHDCWFSVPSSFSCRQWVYADHSPFAVPAAAWLATAFYSSPLLRKLSPYFILSATNRSVDVNEKQMLNTMSFNHAYPAMQSKTSMSSMFSNAWNSSKYPGKDLESTLRYIYRRIMVGSEMDRFRYLLNNTKVKPDQFKKGEMWLQNTKAERW